MELIRPLPELGRVLTHVFVRRTGFPPDYLPFHALPGARRRSRLAYDLRASRHLVEKIPMFSIVVSFGVSTLFATVLLLVVQIVDDFRNG